MKVISLQKFDSRLINKVLNSITVLDKIEKLNLYQNEVNISILQNLSCYDLVLQFFFKCLLLIKQYITISIYFFFNLVNRLTFDAVGKRVRNNWTFHDSRNFVFFYDNYVAFCFAMIEKNLSFQVLFCGHTHKFLCFSNV